MARINLYGEITENTSTRFSEFLAGLADGESAEIHINCVGGLCTEGWAIYDMLRTSGRDITTRIEGQCSSMASVVLLAAPKERRLATKNSTLLIHNPYAPIVEADYMDADKLREVTEQMAIKQADLERERNTMLDCYVERTGSDRDELRELMSKNTYISADEAMRLGFVGAIIEPNTAKKNENKMNKNFIQKLLANIGKCVESMCANIGMVLTDVTGAELTIEREEGEPQVGDTAHPDGTYTLENGNVIVVADGVITSITGPVEEETVTRGGAEAERTALQAEIERLQAEIERLTSAQITEEQSAILARVDQLGGVEWLNNITKVKSATNASKAKAQVVKTTSAEAEKVDGLSSFREAQRLRNEKYLNK